MARLDSFHLTPESWPGQDRAVLAGAEARHMLKVLRLGPGREVRCFDGQGREGVFVIRATARDRVDLDKISESFTPRPEAGLTLALGWNKSSRRGWLLEKAVELDAAGILFWRAERGQGRPPENPKESWQEKLVQAAKQCSAPWLPELSVTGDATQLASIAPRFSGCYVLWEESGEQSRLLTPQDLAQGSCLVVVGPEGGLTKAEVDVLCEAGMVPVTLGKRILRYETAALMALALGAHGRNATLHHTLPTTKP